MRTSPPPSLQFQDLKITLLGLWLDVGTAEEEQVWEGCGEALKSLVMTSLCQERWNGVGMERSCQHRADIRVMLCCSGFYGAHHKERKSDPIS